MVAARLGEVLGVVNGGKLVAQADAVKARAVALVDELVAQHLAIALGGHGWRIEQHAASITTATAATFLQTISGFRFIFVPFAAGSIPAG